jgi:hypothetical protein
MIVRAAFASDFASALALNEASVEFLSPLSRERLIRLDAEAELHCVVEFSGQVMAFLLAFREGADYDSINYQWFAQRYPRFLYVDRVVVSRTQQSHGAGSLLYRHVFAHAAAIGAPLVACEFDVEPPNPVSAGFHAKFGFREVGMQRTAGGKKLVSLQIADVAMT